ncbi:hypothetical protein OHB26_04865 [Nocardia sp. NBC_01503]|uniref:hypothetical protein n=1 Tax=Nocardia sp. NBC_01503 TaxID=2975997 RepID=UPI002E7B7D4B|nr:hypothetical protein [Nocardia sp. NBC_01503]WTL33574.1 hypothetical protein OHB26_04865 [Nocardia sp. NBC_01503]
MLGSPQESHPAYEGDIDPRGLAVVVAVSGLMVLAIGLGMLLTGSGEVGAADPAPARSVPTHQRGSILHPPAAPAAAVPPAKSASANPPATPAPAPSAVSNISPAQVYPPAQPHPVEAPVLLPAG